VYVCACVDAIAWCDVCNSEGIRIEGEEQEVCEVLSIELLLKFFVSNNHTRELIRLVVIAEQILGEIEAMLLVYRYFCGALELLTTVFELYKQTDFQKDRLKLINIVKKWVQTQPDDFDENMQTALRNLIAAIRKRP
jgi:hypothetical protein